MADSGMFARSMAICSSGCMYILDGGMPEISGRGKEEEEDGEVWMCKAVQSCWYWRLCRIWRARARWGSTNPRPCDGGAAMDMVVLKVFGFFGVRGLDCEYRADALEMHVHMYICYLFSTIVMTVALRVA